MLHWICSAIIITIFLACSSGLVSAQTRTTPTITIKPNQPQSVSQNINGVFDSQVPITLALRITVEESRWWFFRLEAVPNGVKLLGAIPGTGTDGEIHGGRWYAFRQPLSLTLLIEPTATSPANLQYLIGRFPEGRRQPNTPEAAQKFAQENRSDIKIEGREQFVKLFWQTERPTITTKPATLDYLVYENNYFEPKELIIEGDNLGWSFIRLQGIPDFLQIRLAESSTSDDVTIAPGSELAEGRWYGFRQILKLKVALKEMVSEKSESKFSIESGEAELPSNTYAAAISAIQRNEIQPHGGNVVLPIALEPSSLTAIAKTFSQSAFWKLIFIGLVILMVGWLIRYFSQQFRQRRRTATQYDETGYGEEPAVLAFADATPAVPVKLRWWSRVPAFLHFGRADGEPAVEGAYSELASRIKALTQLARKSPFIPQVTTIGSDTSDELARAVQSHTRQIREVEQKLTSLEGLLLTTFKTKERLAEIEQMVEERMSPPPNPALEQEAAAKINKLSEELRTALNQHTKALSEQLEEVKQSFSQVSRTLSEQQIQIDENRRRLDDCLNQVRQMALTPPPAAPSIADSRRPTGATEDRLYARLLGHLFARTVDGLEEGLDATVQRAGETLNRFFQNELPPAHVLQDLSLRASEMTAFLEGIAGKGSAIKNEAYGDLRQAAERARRLSREVTSIQTQLQHRDIELDLQIRVSASPGGHAVFLEELGRAVKQTIDKFTDPQAYLEQKLERFITEDIIGLVDLCDHDIAPPGENDEFESSLKQLFRAVGLKPILPIPLEPFQPDVHSIVQLVPGERSQAIARVIRRGFYYKDQVLRKADVAVYN
jgi:hypothetical protein